MFTKDDPVAKTLTDISAIAGPTALLGGAGASGLNSLTRHLCLLLVSVLQVKPKHWALLRGG